MEKEKKEIKFKNYLPIAVAIIVIAIIGIVLFTKGNKTEETKTENNMPKATITDNEGTVTSMSAQELMEIYDSNEANFNKRFLGANIEFTGTIEKIKTNTSVIVNDGVISTDQNVIFFEEGWALVIGKFDDIDLSSYEKGEKLKVTTGIISSAFDTDYVKKVSENKRVVWLAGRAQLSKNNVLTSNYSYYTENTKATKIERVK